MIRLPGYTVREKVDIARRYLWSKQLKEHGLTHDDVSINDDMFRAVVERYTREAGVRTLERRLASLCRRAAVQVASHRMQSAARADEAADGVNDDTTNGVHDVVAVNGDDAPACAGTEAATAPPSDGDAVADHPLDTIVVSDAFVTAALGQPLHELELAMAVRAGCGFSAHCVHSTVLSCGTACRCRRRTTCPGWLLALLGLLPVAVCCLWRRPTCLGQASCALRASSAA